MPLIGHANVEIRAVDKFFERDVRKIVGNLKDVTVKLRADVDMKPVYNKLRTLRKSPHITKPIILTADVNPDAVYRKMDEVWDDFDGRAFTVLVDADGLDAVHEKVTDIRDSLEGTHMAIEAEADTARAETALALAARNRVSHIKADLDPRTIAAFKGTMYTLTGTIPLEAVKSFFTGVAANFEGISVKAGAMTTVLGAASAALLKFGGDAFLIADDLTQVVGIAAAGPAAIGTLAASFTALKLGWSGFSKAFSDGKALKALPKQAQETVVAMKGMGASIQKATQVSYWDAVGDSVESFMKVVRGPLTKGLEGSGRAMGIQTKAMSDVLSEFTSSGQLTSTFEDINKGMENAKGAVSGFTEGFLELMEGGAKSMPAFGTWMSKIGTQFGNWAEDANKTGKITEWIDNAVVRLEQLGSIAKSTVGIFNSIADAARAAGLDGLGELAVGMDKVNAAMQTPAFQGGLVTVFASAKQAMTNAAPGIGRFFGEIGDRAPEIGGLLETAGSTVGQFFDNIGAMLNRDKFWSGLQDLMTGVSSAMEKLEPGFGRLGDALGNTFSIMGTVVDNVAPGLNQLFDLLAQLTDTLGPGIKAVIPIFNEFVQAIMSTIKTIVVPIATAIGNLMEAFAALPPGIQTMLMSLAAIPVGALLVGKAVATLTSLIGALGIKAGLVRGVLSSFASALTAGALLNPRGVLASIGAMGSGFVALGDKSKDASKKAAGSFVAVGDAADKSAKKTNGAVDKAAKSVSGGKGGFFGKIFGGAAIGAMGGLPGILVGAGIATVFAVGTGIASSIAEQRATIQAAGEKAIADTKSYQASYDKVTKTLGADSSAIAAKNLADTTYQVAGIDKSFTDVASSVGQSTDTISKKLTSGLPAFKEYGSTWNDVRVKMEGMDGASQKFTQGLSEIPAAVQRAKASGDFTLADNLERDAQNLMNMRGAWDNNAEGAGEYFRKVYDMSDEQVQKLGMQPAEFDRMTKDQVMNMSRGISDQFNAIAKAGKASAEEVKSAYADANLMAISENQKVLNSSTSTAEQKLAAFQSNLAATGRSAIAQVEQQAFQTQIAVTAVKDGMASMNTTLADQGWNKDNAKGMLNTSKTVKGVLDYTKKGSQEVFQTMSTQAGTIQTAFVSAYDAAIKQNGNMETSLKSAMTSIQPMMDSVRTGLSKTFDKGTVDKIMSSFNLDKESFRVGITADGADAIAEARRVETALQVMESGDYKALLKVDGTNATGEVEKVMGLGKTFSNEKFEAALRVEAANANMDFDSFVARFQTAPDQKEFLLQARAQGIEQTASQMDMIDGKANELDNKTINTFLTAQADSGQLDEFKAKFDGLSDKQKTAIIKAILEGGDVQGKLDAFETPKTTPVTAELTNTVESLVKTQGNGVELPVTMKPTTTDIMGTIMGSLSKPPAQEVPLKYGPLPALSIPAIPDQTANVVVKVEPGQLDSVKSAIAAVKDKSVSVTVSADPGKINSVKTAIAGVKDKSVSVKASADPGKVNSVKTAIAGVKSKNVSVTAKASASQVNSVKTAIAAIKSKAVAITVTASASQVKAMKSAIDAVKAKAVKITATAPPQAVIALKAAIDRVKGKSVSVTASAPSGAVNALRAAIAGVNSKSVRISVTTVKSTINQNDDGGMYMGNVRTFAKGGLDKVSKAIERKERIGGGENRVAQIAKGSQNYRVWGEAETQGEAYIPLSKAKRGRSLKILQKVMDHFGVEAAQTFSNGGALAGKAMGSGITTFASGGISTTTAAKKVAAAEKKLKKEEAQYKKISNKKIDATRKKAAKAELDAAKKNLATAKKTQTTSKETAKKQAEITKNSNKDRRSLLSGFNSGISGTNSQFGRQASPLQNSLSGLRKEASTFISTYKKTRPKEAKAMEKVSKKLAAQGVTSKGFQKLINNGKGNYTQRTERASANLANRAQKVQKTRSTRDDVLRGATLRDYERAIEYTGEALKKAETKLADLKSSRERVVEGLTSAISGEFSLTGFASETNASGFKNSLTSKGLSAYAKAKLNKIKGFKGLINGLLKKGYSPALVEEIAAMGIDDGTILAQSLNKDTSQMKSLNSSYAGINSAAESIGTAVGNKMYNAGISSAQGLVNGLKADEQALKDAAKHLGDILYKEFKKALGIKSPSRVMAKLGRFIPQGVALGIDSEKDVVKRSIQDLVQPKDLTLNGNKTANGLPPLAKAASSNGIIGGTQPTVIVNPSPGMDEVLVGQAAAREMMYRLQ